MMNGIDRDMPFEDAIGIAEMLVEMKRAIPPRDWVDWMIQQADDAATPWDI